ncbi:MAG: TlpA family protein disulfide reductase [Bradymonadaceae bacterium]
MNTAVRFLVALALLSFPVAAGAEVSSGDQPTVEATTIDGEPLDSSDWRGTVVLVDFWATWCTPCRKSFPFYAKLAQKYDRENFRVVAVSVDEKRADIVDFLDEFDVPFDVVHDADHTLAERFEPPTMPTSYLIGPGGTVREVHEGFRPEDKPTIERRVADLVADARSAGGSTNSKD